jgi:EF hand
MRTRLWTLTAVALLAGPLAAQPPDAAKKVKGPPDEEKAILEEIREAYKAPHEVPKDMAKELRKAYENPSPDREEKVLKEARRMYDLSGGREEAILRLIRAGYGQLPPGHEDRVLLEIQKAPRLPEGTVPTTVRESQARKLFSRFDTNGDGVLTTDEMPESLRADRARWDANRDGVIDQAEYAAYHLGRLRNLSEQVVAGQIDLKLKFKPLEGTPPADATRPADAPPPEADKRPAVMRAGKLPAGLPDWFVKLDTDGDGQVGLYEWKDSGRPLTEFAAIDRNGDGLITPDEMLRYLVDHPEAKAAVTSSGKSKKH